MSGCILAHGAASAKGYGRVRFRGKRMLAHRAAFIASRGEIPEGAIVHHTCGTKMCVNPEHLQLLASNTEHRAVHRLKSCPRCGGPRRQLPSGQWQCPPCNVVRVQEWRRRQREKEAMTYQA